MTDIKNNCATLRAETTMPSLPLPTSTTVHNVSDNGSLVAGDHRKVRAGCW